MKILFMLCALIVAVSCDKWSTQIVGNCYRIMLLADKQQDSVAGEYCCKTAWLKTDVFPGFNVNQDTKTNKAALNNKANYDKFIGNKKGCTPIGKW